MKIAIFIILGVLERNLVKQFRTFHRLGPGLDRREFHGIPPLSTTGHRLPAISYWLSAIGGTGLGRAWDAPWDGQNPQCLQALGRWYALFTPPARRKQLPALWDALPWL